MLWHYAIEAIAALIMMGAVGGILYGVFKGTLAFSNRTIHFLAISFALPGVIILSLERTMGSDAASALIGTILGFVLAGIGRNE